jgi:predicted nucleic acid-binding protein
MILSSAMYDSSQAVALLLQVKAKVWAEFMELPAGEEQQQTYAAWNSLNHAIRSVQRQDGEARKPVVSRISRREAKRAREETASKTQAPVSTQKEVGVKTAAMRVAHPDPSHQQIIAELEGQKCQCGRRKAAGAPFCRRCFEKLTDGFRVALSCNGNMYDAAYLAAAKFLKVGRK